MKKLTLKQLKNMCKPHNIKDISKYIRDWLNDKDKYKSVSCPFCGLYCHICEKVFPDIQVNKKCPCQVYSVPVVVAKVKELWNVCDINNI